MLTDGSGSHPHSSRFPRDALVALRRQETLVAASALDVTDGNVTFLELRDAHAPLSGPEFDGTVDRIDDVAKLAGARALFVTWRHDPHCDHEAAAAMALAVQERHPGLRLWAYPIWGWHLDPAADVDCAEPRGLKVDVTPWQSKKRAAIDAHASQMSDLIDDDPSGFQMTPAQREPFLGRYEYFIEVDR